MEWPGPNQSRGAKGSAEGAVPEQEPEEVPAGLGTPADAITGSPNKTYCVRWDVGPRTPRSR
jgi:hypothetical protein